MELTRRRIFYHATTPEAAAAILRSGFKQGFGAQWGAYLGPGVYVAAMPGDALRSDRTHVVLRVQAPSRCRILDLTVTPDAARLQSLAQRYGRALWKGRGLEGVRPQRGNLTNREAADLLRHIYRQQRSWNSWAQRTRRRTWPSRRPLLAERLKTVVRSYKWDAFGDPASIVGVLFLRPDSLTPLAIEKMLVFSSPIPPWPRLYLSADDVKVSLGVDWYLRRRWAKEVSDTEPAGERTRRMYLARIIELVPEAWQDVSRRHTLQDAGSVQRAACDLSEALSRVLKTK